MRKKLMPLLVAAVAVGVASSARAAFVQFSTNFPANADVVAESAAAAPQGIDSSGRAFLSATQAASRATVGQIANGLPDNGQINVTGGVVQLLGYAGNNVARRTDNTPILVPVSQNKYNSISLYATSSGGSQITVTFNYTDGSSLPNGPIPVPDWFADVGDAGFPAGVGYLVNGLDQTGPSGAGFNDANDPAIFNVQISDSTNIDPSRTLTSISIARTGAGTDILNLFAVTGNTAPVPEPATVGLLGLGALGLLARRVRRA